MKKTYRFTFTEEHHRDVIHMIERCPKPLRSELIVTALRYLERSKDQLFNQVLTKSQDTEKIKSSIDISKAFEEV